MDEFRPGMERELLWTAIVDSVVENNAFVMVRVLKG